MYLNLQEKEKLVWQDIDEVFHLTATFMNPILAKQKRVWHHKDFVWKEVEE